MPVQIPQNHLTETRIFHITAIQNLSSILQSGCIYSTNTINGEHVSIANEEIQERRATKIVAVEPYGVLHDYVPFYFAPRSPMLYANHRAAVANASAQEDIIHIVSTAQQVASAQLPYVFYDQHAVTNYALAYNCINDLDKIDWELFFELPLLEGYSKYWQDKHDEEHPKWINRKAVRQAEFLVQNNVAWQNVLFIATMNEERTLQVAALLEEHNSNIPVYTKRGWYF